MLGDAPRQVLDHDRREAERQLVDQQQLGLAHDGAAERQHLAFATRQQPGEPRAQRAPAPGKNWNTSASRLAPLGRVGAARGRDGQILGDGEIGKHLVALRHQHDAARGIGMRRLVLDPLARRKRMLPAVTRASSRPMKPEMARSVVVLPAPLLPSSATMVCGMTR